jgi:hypothetical protein
MKYTTIIKAHHVTGGQAELQFKLGLIGHTVK